MMRAGVIGTRALLAAGLFAIFAVTAGCGGSTPEPKEPALEANPPQGKNAGAPKAAAATEVQRGKTFLENEKFADAKEHLLKAVELDPKNVQARHYLGLASEGVGDPAGAEAAYKEALSIDPKYTAAAKDLSALYLGDPPRPDEAIKLLNETLAQAPDDVGLLQNLAYAYTLKKDVANASKQYDAILSKKGGDTPQIRLAYADLLMASKQREKAAEQLKKVLSVTEDNVTKLVTVGRLLASAGALGDCVTAFNRAIAIKSDDPELFMRRGRCRQELKDEAAARGDFEAALKIDPKFVPAHYWLGVSWLADKKTTTARASFEKAAELGKGTEIGKLAQKKLDELPKK